MPLPVPRQLEYTDHSLVCQKSESTGHSCTLSVSRYPPADRYRCRCRYRHRYRWYRWSTSINVSLSCLHSCAVASSADHALRTIHRVSLSGRAGPFTDHVFESALRNEIPYYSLQLRREAIVFTLQTCSRHIHICIYAAGSTYTQLYLTYGLPARLYSLAHLLGPEIAHFSTLA